MSFLLDTNICSAHFRRPGGLAHRFLQYSGRLYVPTIVLGELYAGASHCADPTPLLAKISELLQDVQVLDFDHECARQFGRIRGELLKQGVSVPTVDLHDCSGGVGQRADACHSQCCRFPQCPGVTTG